MADLIYVNKSDGGLEQNEVIEQFLNSETLEEMKGIVTQSSDRMFLSWASVDVTDRDNEVIPIEDIIASQDTLLKRGGAITDGHTNKIVGKTLAYKVMRHPKTGTVGVLHLNLIYNDNDLDDQVWNEIQQGKRTGSSVGGGHEGDHMETDPKTGMPRRVLENFFQYETATVHNPANPFALNEAVSIVAKSVQSVSKPFAGYKDFQDCVNQNSDKEDPHAYCATIMRAVEKANRESVINKDAHKKETGEYNMVENNTNKQDAGKTENVSKEEFDSLKKDVSSISETLKKLDKALQKKQEEEEEDPEKEEPEDDGSEDDEKNKKAVDESGDEKPEEPKPDEANQEDTYKAEKLQKDLEVLKSEVESLKKNSSEKSQTPRPGATSKDKVKDVNKQADVVKELAYGKKKMNWLEAEKLVKDIKKGANATQ